MRARKAFHAPTAGSSAPSIRRRRNPPSRACSHKVSQLAAQCRTCSPLDCGITPVGTPTCPVANANRGSWERVSTRSARCAHATSGQAYPFARLAPLGALFGLPSTLFKLPLPFFTVFAAFFKPSFALARVSWSRSSALAPCAAGCTTLLPVSALSPCICCGSCAFWRCAKAIRRPATALISTAPCAIVRRIS